MPSNLHGGNGQPRWPTVDADAYPVKTGTLMFGSTPQNYLPTFDFFFDLHLGSFELPNGAGFMIRLPQPESSWFPFYSFQRAFCCQVRRQYPET